MKSILILATAVTSFSASANSSPVANFFTCKGDKIDVVFWSAGPTNGASLFIAEQGFSPLNFTNEFIQFKSSQWGTSATVVLARAYDAFVTTAEFIVPSVNIEGFNSVPNVKTLLVYKTEFTSIAGPDLVVGALRELKAVNLNCRAENLYD